MLQVMKKKLPEICPELMEMGQKWLDLLSEGDEQRETSEGRTS